MVDESKDTVPLTVQIPRKLKAKLRLEAAKRDLALKVLVKMVLEAGLAK